MSSTVFRSPHLSLLALVLGACSGTGPDGASAGRPDAGSDARTTSSGDSGATSDGGADGWAGDADSPMDGGSDAALGTGNVMPTHAVPSGGLNPAADAEFAAYDGAFLVTSGSSAFYKTSIANTKAAGTWVASLEIMAAEDAYERTGSDAQKTLVNDLCATWLKNTPTPWDWDGWNDDIGWFSLALVRGYRMTGTTAFLTAATYGFNMAFSRGWDTQYNGGGIWEQQPDKTPAGQPINKQALSNDSLGKVGAIIYQSNLDPTYLSRATQIYDWVWHHIYDSTTGLVENGIDRSNVVDTSANVYNQGTFVDFANLLYEITGTTSYYDDAKRSIEYVKSKMTQKGVISNSASYLDTWADEFARGLGHFTRDNGQWDAYYPWLTQNATAIWSNRRTDDNVTWNGWAAQTPSDDTLTTSKFASAVAWFQFTPATKPDTTGGIHSIVSKQDGTAIDAAGQTAAGTSLVQTVLTHGQSQKWLLTQNDDTSWNIVSLSSWLSMEVPGGSERIGTPITQSHPTRGDGQRWWLDPQADGSYEISNEATGGALFGTAPSPTGCPSPNGCPLVQSSWNGGSDQRWLLQ